MNTSTTIIIPARYASTRLPGKPLLRATGKYLIQHVYETACAVKCAQEVIVATDDERIAAAVAEFGGRAVLTAAQHTSGTDRIAEVARSLDSSIIVNLQGDEPEIAPAAIDQVIQDLQAHPRTVMATLAAPLERSQAHNPNIVKVVCDCQNQALYFSRSPIPYCHSDGTAECRLLGHIGLYAYRRDFLLRLSTMPPTSLEISERLEQLRVLENGHRIMVSITSEWRKGIDTPEDYQAFIMRQQLKRADI